MDVVDIVQAMSMGVVDIVQAMSMDVVAHVLSQFLILSLDLVNCRLVGGLMSFYYLFQLSYHLILLRHLLLINYPEISQILPML